MFILCGFKIEHYLTLRIAINGLQAQCRIKKIVGNRLHLDAGGVLFIDALIEQNSIC